MKKIITALVICFLGVVLCARGFGGISNDDFRQALYKAVDSAAPALKKANFGKKRIAVLPMKHDTNNLVSGRIYSVLDRLGFFCTDSNEEKELIKKICSEAAAGGQTVDLSDPATFAKFEKLKNTQLLISCRLLNFSQDSNRLFVEIELNAADIAARKRIWGGVFAGRHYPGKDVHGVAKIDPKLAALLKKELSTIKTSLNSSITRSKLGKTKKIVVIPISGDVDHYITDMVITALSQTQYLPEYTDIPSISQFRNTVADDIAAAKIVCYGAVRDLHVTTPVEKFSADKRSIITTRTVRAEVQLTIEDAASRTILWRENFTVNAPQEEVKMLPRDYSDYLGIIGVVVGVILLLLVVFFIISKILAARNNIR